MMRAGRWLRRRLRRAAGQAAKSTGGGEEERRTEVRGVEAVLAGVVGGAGGWRLGGLGEERKAVAADGGCGGACVSGTDSCCGDWRRTTTRTEYADAAGTVAVTGS